GDRVLELDRPVGDGRGARKQGQDDRQGGQKRAHAVILRECFAGRGVRPAGFDRMGHPSGPAAGGPADGYDSRPMPGMNPREQTDWGGRSGAKINLTLAVGPPRPDGYHGVESLVAQVSLADEVVVRGGPPGTVSVECDQPEIPCDESNLAVRTAR